MLEKLGIKLRPKNFREVCGHKLTIDLLKHAINHEDQRCFLLFGQSGAGKTTLARIFSKAVNCLNLKDSEPCNKCERCIYVEENLLSDGTSDIIEVDAATFNGVDNIRVILSFTKFYPTILKNKVIILDEVHKLSTAAFDSLLKTLEDTPNYVRILLLTTEIEKIPKTVSNRCLRLYVSSLSEMEIYNYLIPHKNDLSLNSLKVISEISNGSLREALANLEKIIKLNIDNPEEIYDLLKVYSNKNICNILYHIFEGKPKLAIEYWRSLRDKGYSEKLFFKKTNETLLNLYYYSIDKTYVIEKELMDLIEKFNIKNIFIINCIDIVFRMGEALYMFCDNTVEWTIITFSHLKSSDNIDFKFKN